MKFKTEIKSKRLSTSIDKKVTEINNRFKKLDTSLDQLKKLVDKKRTNTDERIQATKDITSIIIGEFTKKRKETESTFNTERDKYTEDTTRQSTEIEKEIQTMKVILAEMEEQHDQTKRGAQEQEAAERSRIENEIQIMKAKIAEEKDRYDREIANMKAKEAEEKDTIDREIENLKAKEAEEKGRIDREIANMKVKEAKEKDRIDREIENMKAKEAEEKDRIDREIAKMKAKEAKEKDRIDSEIENFKEKEAEENDRIEHEITKLNEEVKEYEVKIKNMADEEVLAKMNLNVTLEILQTDLKKMTQEKEKIEGIIIKMNAIINNRKKAMDDCIKASTERLINIKNNIKENFKLMDQIEENKKREVDAEIQNLRNVENHILETIENNIQTL